MTLVRPGLALLALLGVLAGGAVVSQDRPAPVADAPMALGAAANFSQGWSEPTFAAATELGVTQYRDAILWAEVERTPGQYRFDGRKAQYPARLAESGAQLVLTVGGSNPIYDDGQTPHSPAAVAAFARFVAAVVREYPAVSAVEVGNEFNSGDFVSGPVRTGGIAQRARYHLTLVRAVAAEVRAVRPDVPVLGGATHSLPAGYLWSVLEGAGPGLVDGLAVHPYTTPIDQLPAQVGVLRRNPAARTMSLYVTEWGTQDEARAPDHLLRGYAAMSSLGFATLDWYPLNERGDRMVPLIRRDGSVTGVGEAFAFIQRELARYRARDISPDAFTFVHAFGDKRLVLWGEPRPVTFAGSGISAFDARGRRLDPAELALSPETGLVLVSDQPLLLGENVRLGCAPLLADSYYQFTFPARGGEQAAGFTAAWRGEQQERALVTLPGQQRSGVPWMPYLGLHDNAAIRLTAERLVLPPARQGESGLIVRWTPPAGGDFRLSAVINPAARSRQPLSVTIRQRGQELFALSQSEAMRFDGPISNAPLEISLSAVGAEASAAEYRLRIYDDARCPG